MARKGLSRTIVTIMALLIVALVGVPLALAALSPGYLLVDLRLPAAVGVLLVGGLLASQIARRLKH